MAKTKKVSRGYKRKQDRIIPHAPMKRLASAAGVKRLAKDAYPAIEDDIQAVLQAADVIAHHAKRKTVRKSDILLARRVKELKR